MWNQAEIYRRRRRTFAAGVGLVLLLIIIIAVSGGGSPVKHVARNTTLPTSPAPLLYSGSAALTEALRASSAAPIPGQNAFTLFGGLDANNNATAEVATVSPTQAKSVGTLPVTLYGAAAVTLGKTEYIFGGATGSLSSSTVELGILSYNPTSSASAVTEIAHLPSANDGLAAAVIGSTAYVVGGYDGTTTLSAIDAWKPGEAKATQVASLPLPLSYTAVAAVGDRLVIAGGLMASGAASRQIFIFDSRTDKVTRLKEELPTAIFAAAGASLGKLAYVIGGAVPSGSSSTPPTTLATIYSVNPASGQLARAGTMGIPRGEATAVVVGAKTIYLAGGFSNGTTIDGVGSLAPASSQTTASGN
jgi:N-acetylneuraminic acid mutarotase